MINATHREIRRIDVNQMTRTALYGNFGAQHGHECDLMIVSAQNALNPELEEFASESQRRKRILRERE